MMNNTTTPHRPVHLHVSEDRFEHEYDNVYRATAHVTYDTWQRTNVGDHVVLAWTDEFTAEVIDRPEVGELWLEITR